MSYIAPVPAVVTAPVFDRGPSAAQMTAIEREMPVIAAEVELLDAQIMILDRVPTELDAQRIRRARRRLLAARRDLTNQPPTPTPAFEMLEVGA
ncbi:MULTISPECIES: DUF6284 family protein [Streptomyces]|uniref:DUF6284 family protein n=1 Tax=Streptomyces TaxID=1883 RepID=UPI000B9E5F61|nr:DUF6284 family protein [Streptomyces kasugaensis]